MENVPSPDEVGRHSPPRGRR